MLYKHPLPLLRVYVSILQSPLGLKVELAHFGTSTQLRRTLLVSFRQIQNHKNEDAEQTGRDRNRHIALEDGRLLGLLEQQDYRQRGMRRHLRGSQALNENATELYVAVTMPRFSDEFVMTDAAPVISGVSFYNTHKHRSTQLQLLSYQ